MTEITRDYKEVLGIIQIRRQEFSVGSFCSLVQSPDQDRDDLDGLLLKDLVYIRQMHL